jgi:hypothetical protein
MADSHPIDNGPTAALTLSADHIRILRGVFEDAHEGAREDLANYPEGLKDPAHLRRDVDAYGQLLTALDESEVVPDAEVLAVVRDLAKMIDGSNEYGRVVAEHDALHGLLEQLTGGR